MPQTKIAVFSDLHLVFGPLDYKLEIPADVGIVVVAGDVSDPIEGSLKWLYENVALNGANVVFVAGNHEHYSHNYDRNIDHARKIAKDYPGVHYLENDEVIIDGIRFLGATLWTDFNLYGDPKAAMDHARRYMNDYRTITSFLPGNRYGNFSPEISVDLHNESKAWLETALSKDFDGPTVVVTHHCPHPMSVAEKYAGDALNPAFTADLSKVISKYQPDLWIHGHTHTNFDYVVPETKTRVVCNPRGYVRTRFSGGKTVENPEFESIKIVTV